MHKLNLQFWIVGGLYTTFFKRKLKTMVSIKSELQATGEV